MGDLGATYFDHLRLVGKRVGDFLLVLIELFRYHHHHFFIITCDIPHKFYNIGRTAEALRVIIGSKSAISLQRGPVDPKFQIEWVAPTNHSTSQKTRINVLSYDIKI